MKKEIIVEKYDFEGESEMLVKEDKKRKIYLNNLLDDLED